MPIGSSNTRDESGLELDSPVLCVGKYPFDTCDNTSMQYSAFATAGGYCTIVTQQRLYRDMR